MKTQWLGALVIVALLSGCATSRMGEAERLIKKERYDEAVRVYLRELEPHVKDGKRLVYYDREIITGLGEAYWLMQRYETASKILLSVIEKEPYYGKAQFYYGLCMEQMADDQKALDIYRKYPRLPGSDPYRYVMAGRLDWLTRRLITREVQAALRDESSLSNTTLPSNSVAVLYFMSQSEDPQWAPLQKGLAEMISNDLAQSGELRVVERLRLNYLMEELRMDVAGISEESSQTRLGKLLGANTLVKGSYMVLPDLKMTLDAGIFQNSAAAFPKPASFEGNLARLFQMEKQLVLEVFDYFGIQLTLEARERILQIPTEDMEAFMHYCLGLDALDRMDFEGAQRSFQKAVTIDPTFQMARDYLVPAKVWEFTHSQNVVRLQRDVVQFVERLPRGGPERLLRPEEGLVSAWKRLQRLSAYQGAGFLPGNDTREGFQEADDKGARVLPETLGVPPNPVRQQ